jgi:GxxExxY protein
MKWGVDGFGLDTKTPRHKVHEERSGHRGRCGMASDFDEDFEELPAELERVATQIVDAAFKVHSELGAGLLESVYEKCLARELTKRGLGVRRQVLVPIVYDGEVLEEPLRLDLLVEESVVVEVKAVEKMHPVFNSQMLTYLKLSKKRLGFIINFNVPLIKDGIKRVIR